MASKGPTWKAAATKMKAMEKFRNSKRNKGEKASLIDDRTSYGSRSPSLTRSPNSSTSSDIGLPTVKVRAGSSPPTSPYDKSASMAIDFDQVPFKMFTKTSLNSTEAYLQTTAMMVVCVLVPSLLLLIGMLINEIRMKQKKRMKNEEKRSQRMLFLYMFVVLLIKDVIIVSIILHVVFDSKASSFELAYGPIVYLTVLFLFGAPLLYHRYSCSKYVFGDDPELTLLKSALPFLTNKTQESEEKKTEEQERKFSVHFKSFSAVQGPNDELKFVRDSTCRLVRILAIVLAIVVICIHAFLPLYEQIAFRPNFQHQVALVNQTYLTDMPEEVDSVVEALQNQTVFNNTSNVTLNHTDTKGQTMFFTVVSLSTINSCMTSFALAAFFLFAICSKLAMLFEWNRFNTSEEGKSTILVNSGPHGIAMWWKIMQKLKFCSSSSQCMSVNLTSMLCYASTLLILLMSLPLLFTVRSTEFDHDTRLSVIICVLNSVLLYVGLSIIAILVARIRGKMAHAHNLMRLKQLNIGYHLGQLMTLEQDTIENEPSVRIKTRSMRGCLMVLQELTTVLPHADNTSTTDYSIFACFVVSTLLIIPSTFIGARYLFIALPP